MSGLEALAILAAIPVFIQAAVSSYKTITDMVEHYKHRKTLVLYFRTEIGIEESRIMSGLETLRMIMDQWGKESTHEGNFVGNRVPVGFISDSVQSDEAKNQISKMEDGGNQRNDNLPPVISHIVWQLKTSQTVLVGIAEELNAYQTKFQTPSHGWIEKFTSEAKFVIEGYDALANSLIKLRNLTKDWMLETMVVMQRLTYSTLCRIDGRDGIAVSPDRGALSAVLEMRKRVEGGSDGTLVQRIDVSLMGNYTDYRPLQNEDVEEFGIRRPGGPGLSPDFARSVVDCRPLRWRDREDIRKDTERIARLLCGDVAVDPITFEAGTGGLLKCQGYVERTGQAQRFELVFQIPNGYSSDPQTLRSLLIDVAKPSFKKRYELALKLAGTIFILQTTGFVHKRVRPDSVLLIKPTYWETSKSLDYASDIGEPFLLGWGEARSEDGSTQKVSWSARMQPTSYNLAYTHPRDVGVQRNDEYRNLDDVYSFGVTLIEIALWKSFFVWQEDEKRYVNNNSKVDIDARSPTNPLNGIYENFKKLAKNELESEMGPAFSEAVFDCLSCFEKPFNFGPPSQGKNKDVVNMKFKELVVKKLRNAYNNI